MKTRTIVNALFVIVPVFFLLNATAQTDWTCASVDPPYSNNSPNATCTRSSTAWVNRYNKVATWIPSSTSPMKFVGVNFIVIQNNSGANNFTNNTSDLNDLNNIFNWMRNLYVNNPPPSDPILGVTELTSKGIDFILEGVYFYQNTTLNGSANISSMIQYLQQIDLYPSIFI